MSALPPASSWHKTRRRLVGVVFLVVFALLIWLSIALYDKQFTPEAMVTLDAGSIGNELHVHAEVEARGVEVGEVRSITGTGSSAQLVLAIQPAKVAELPANVSAELLPTTLFGERHVELVLPANPSAARLADGSVIGEDRSSSAIELEQVFTDLMPMLQAVQPQKLSVTLSAVSQALQGRGAELGRTLVQLNSYLQGFNAQLPALDNDITQFVGTVDGYDRAAPDIVQALDDFTTTSKTIVAQQQQLTELFASVTGTSQDLTTFLRVNANTIIRLSAGSTSTLQALARYSPEFPCTLQALVAFEPQMDRALGKGTSQPGLHVNVTTSQSRGQYLPGRDTPRYDHDGGPVCYPLGAAPQTRSGTTESAAQADPQVATGGLGLANSPQENEFVNELAAPSLNTTPQSLPDWSSVLLGPIYRGTEVTVK
jgi:phospholipid/cholesterol/gamma-HCH transport system substrate-binding protein